MLWSWTRLQATHTARDVIFNGERITLKPGQFITSRKSAIAGTGIERNRLERLWKTMESEQEIEQLSSNQNRLITILNWHDDQVSEQRGEQPVSNERATSEQPVSTNNNVKKAEKEKKDTIAWDDVTSRWNKLASGNALPAIQSMSDDRRKKYRTRMTSTPDLWEVIGRELPLLGDFARTSRWFGFPWLIHSDENFLKFSEGKYRENPKPSTGSSGPSRSFDELDLGS